MADLALLREIARADNFLAVLSVTRPDGTVHASVVKAGILDDPRDGEPSVGVVVAGTARKLEHLRRSRYATIVFKDEGRWAAAEGPARLEGPDDPAPPGPSRPPLALIRAIYVAAGGAHDNWEEFDRVMTEERRCAVLIKPRRIWGNG